MRQFRIPMRNCAHYVICRISGSAAHSDRLELKGASREKKRSIHRRPPFSSTCAFNADFNRNLTLLQPRLNGADVLAVQQGLLALGFQGIGIADGWYGPKTESVVKSFQRYMGFNQDGVVDRMLWNALFTVGGIMVEFSADLESANSLSFDRLTKTVFFIPAHYGQGCVQFIVASYFT
jgi:hypothetical protein